MAGYIGSKSSVTQVDGYSEAEADAEFVTKTGDTMSGNLDVTGTVTSDGLTVDGIATFNAPNSIIRIMESDTTDTNTQIQNNGGDLHIQTVVDNLSSSKDRISLDHATGDISFYEDTGTTAKFFWDASAESLGIGTSSPSKPFHLKTPSGWATVRLEGATDSGGELEFYKGSTKAGAIFFDNSNNLNIRTGNTQRMRITSSGLLEASHDAYDGMQRSLTLSNPRNSAGTGDGTSIYFNNTGTATIARSAYIGGVSEGNYGQSNALVFGTSSGGSSPTERMRILSSGAKDFGSFESHSGGYNGKFKAGSAASYALRLDAIGTGSAGVLQIVNGYGQVGSISVSGASTSFNTSSDYRLKTDVQPMTGASARVQALNPVNFEWIADGNRTDGFLAHELATVVPEATTGDKDAMKNDEYEVTPAIEATYDEEGNELTPLVSAVMGLQTVPSYQSIDQSKLVPLLTAALQEALAEITSLKTRVEALEDV